MIGLSLILVLVFLISGLTAVSAIDLDDANSTLSKDLSDKNLLMENPSESLDDDSEPMDNSIGSVDSNVNSISSNSSIGSIGSIGSIDSNSSFDSINSFDSNNDSINILELEKSSNSKLKSNGNQIHTITENNYSKYFDSKGFLNLSLVSVNDTINLSGNFTNKNFVITIPLTLTSLECDAFLYNSRVAFVNVSNEDYKYSAVISNLKMESHKDRLLAVEVNGSNCVKVIDNEIFTSGSNAYPISIISYSYDCIVANNTIRTIVPNNATRSSMNDETNASDNSSWQHSGITLLDAFRTQVIDNDITVENSYGVYLCYGSTTSDYNNISNNTIRSTVDNPSFWAYGIYLMGKYNNVENNTIISMYRGVSSAYPNNYIIGNKIYNLTGADLENPDIIGGDYAIYSSYGNLIANNSIYNAKVFKAGIIVGESCEAYGNYIQIISNGNGIKIGGEEIGSNSKVYNNTIEFLNGTGISIEGNPVNSLVYGNIINSLDESDMELIVSASTGEGASNLDSPSSIKATGNGIGIQSIYQSRTKRPYNVSIFNNTIYTSNNYAIIIAQSSTESYLCENNSVFGKAIILPMNTSYIPNFGEGKVYYIDNNNYSSYFDGNGKLKGFIEDGDTLIFSGNFSPIGKLYLSKTLNLIGENASLFNTTIVVNAPNCLIEGFTIINNGSSDKNCNQWGIYVFEADEAIIVGNNIMVWDKNTSYAIYLCDSYGSVVTDNYLRAQGDNLVFTLLNYEAYETVFENNDIVAVGTSELYPYFESICIDGVHSISELSKTYGVILDFSSDNQFIHNNIYVTSTVEGFQIPYQPSVNILIGLYIYYASNRNNISENNFLIEGHDPFLYGVGSSGDDTSKSVTYACENIFARNNITINGDYFVMGMILRHNSKDTLVEENLFHLYSNNYTYGITLEISQGGKIRNNSLNCTGRAGIYAMELYSSWSNDISHNNFYANGSISSIAFYASSGNNVTYNKIRTWGDDANDPAQGPEHPDSVTLNNTAMLFEKGSSGNRIIGNDIQTDGDYAMDFDETSNGNTVYGNSMSSSKGGGSSAIANRGFNNIGQNTGERYVPSDSNIPNSNANSNSNFNSSNSNANERGGSSELSGQSQESGSSAYGDIDLSLNPTALSSVGPGEGDSGLGDLIVSEVEEVSQKSLDFGVSVPIAGLLLVLIFCFSFLNAKDEDDEDLED